jgi:hypothetical protein
VEGAGSEQTRVLQLEREFGESVVRVTYVDGYCLRGTLGEGIWKCGGKIGLEAVAEIVVEERRERTERSKREAAVHSLCGSVSRERQSTHLGGLHFREVKEIYERVLRVEHEEHRKIGQRNVHQFTKRVWSITFNTVLTARVPDAAPRQVKQAVRKGVEMLLKHGGDGITKAVADRLSRSLRVTNTRPRTVTGMLAGWRKQCGDYDCDVPAACT